MSLFVLDTDILSLWQHGHAAVSQHVAAHSQSELAVAVITVQEQLDGWHARLPRAKRPKQIADLYQRLADTVRFLARVEILPYTEQAIARYDQLRKLKLNVGKMDLRIAAVVLEHGAVLVTRNVRDFQWIPNLTIEDWSK
jgi:tRNA(fMet)-specific endonuclease VapC